MVERPTDEEEQEDLEEGDEVSEDEEIDEEISAKPSRPSILSQLLVAPPRPITITPVLSAPQERILLPKPQANQEETTEEFVELSKDDSDFIFGGLDDEMISTPKTDVVSLSEKDKEFLTGVNIEDITGMKASKPKVKYTVSNKSKKSRKSQDEDVDEFLFGTKGVL